MLECVVNISIGDDLKVVDELAVVCGEDLLDVHSDAFHNRSVFTLLGTRAPRKLTRLAIKRIDLNDHTGVHPRLGVVDVVPFIPLGDSTLSDALNARDKFARFVAQDLAVPCFTYGPNRSLPDIRRKAWKELNPDFGPSSPHPTAGAICVGARDLLVAYNIWLAEDDLALAKRIASKIRQPALRSLGLQVGERVQVSMNLVEPFVLGPAEAYDLVGEHGEIAGAELVGLVPEDVLESTPAHRWEELDLSPKRVLRI